MSNLKIWVNDIEISKEECPFIWFWLIISDNAYDCNKGYYNNYNGEVFVDDLKYELKDLGDKLSNKEKKIIDDVEKNNYKLNIFFTND